MAATQQKSDKLLAALDSAIPRHRYKTNIGIRTKGRGFVRPTKASNLKQVMETPQAMLVGGAKCESVVMLKNLAKLLVDRIEAACAARNQPQVANPRGNLNDGLPSHGPNPKRNPNDDLPSRGPNSRRIANQEVGNSHEYGSNSDVDELGAVSTQKRHSPSLGTQQPSRQLGDDSSCQCIQEANRSCDDSSLGNPNHGSSRFWESSETCKPHDSRPSSQPNPSDSSWERCGPNCSRPSSQPNLSGSISEAFGGPDSRPNSRMPSREWTATPVRRVASLSSRMLTLKKVNVGLDDCEIKPPLKGLHSTTGRKLWSPGLRSLVVHQVKNLPTPPARPPANTKLVLTSSSKSMQKETKGKDEWVQKEAKQSVGEEVYETVWTDVIQDVFDEVFGDQGNQPSHAANKKHESYQASRPLHGSEEWIVQAQSIKYSYSTNTGGATRDVHSSANVDKRYVTAPLTSKEPPQLSTKSREVSSRAPVSLPTLAKYHMDKIERYKQCVAEKQLRDARQFQPECSSRPSTAPDPYNVLNVYTERYASQKHSKPPTQKLSASAHDWDGRGKLHKPMVSPNQPRSIPGERALATNMHDRCRAMSAGSIPLQNQLTHGSEMDRSHEKFINLRQDARGATNLRREPSRSELKERNSDAKTSKKWYLNGAGDNQHLLPAVHDLQGIPANSEAVSKKTRFMDHWPLLDRQIEAFIQAHILQCCILFKNIPPVFPTLEYQEEIQRIYSGHPLSTR